MSNPSKARGTAAETGLLRWFRSVDRDARRNPPAGSHDIGDLTVWDALGNETVVEVKHYAGERMSTALAKGVTELEAEKRNAGTERGVLVVRRPGKTDPGLWYAVRLVKDDPEIGAL